MGSQPAATVGAYQELIAFLGERFEAIGRRFETMDRRFDVVDRRLDDLRTEILGQIEKRLSSS